MAVLCVYENTLAALGRDDKLMAVVAFWTPERSRWKSGFDEDPFKTYIDACPGPSFSCTQAWFTLGLSYICGPSWAHWTCVSVGWWDLSIEEAWAPAAQDWSYGFIVTLLPGIIRVLLCTKIHFLQSNKCVILRLFLGSLSFYESVYGIKIKDCWCKWDVYF